MKSVGRSKHSKMRRANSSLSLKKKRNSVNSKAMDGKSLREAVIAGDFMSASLIIAKTREGDVVDVNSLDEWGWTLLHTALVGDNVAMATMLIDAGADITAKTPDGDTSLHLLLSTQDLQDPDSHVVKDANLVLELLLEHNADVLAVNNDGNSALHLCGKSGYQFGAQKLLDSKADVDILNGSGETALHMATRNKHLSVIQLLLQNDSVDCAVKGVDGCTPLEIALNCGWDEGIAALKDRSPPPGPRSNTGGEEEPVENPFISVSDDQQESIRVRYGSAQVPGVTGSGGGYWWPPAQRYREEFFQRAHQLFHQQQDGAFAVLAVHKRSQHWMRFSDAGLMSGTAKHDMKGWTPVPKRSMYLMKAALLAMEAKIGQTKVCSVGVLFGEPNQRTEEQMQSNPWNEHYASIVNMLQDEDSYLSWRGYQVTLHVAPRMSDDDRRRLIGNDRVMLYVLTGDDPLQAAFRGNVNGFAVVVRERADGLYDVGVFHRARVSVAPAALQFERRSYTLRELRPVLLALLIAGNYAVNTSPPYTVTLQKLAHAELEEIKGAFKGLL